MRARPRTALVGAGRLARALVPSLVAAGYGPITVLSPGGRGARILARGRRGVAAAPLTAPLSADVRLVLLAVPDDRIAEVARVLASSGVPWKGRVVLHTAGALGLAPLAPLTRRSASVGVLHPLRVFGTAPAPVRGETLCRVEGGAGARRVAACLARDLGWVPLTVRRSALYHAGASLASNDVVALLDLAVSALMRAGVPELRARAGVLALAESALAQARAGGIPAAMTGPAARGDARTVRRHLAALRGATFASIAHAALSMHLARVAERLGRLEAPGRRAVERVARART